LETVAGQSIDLLLQLSELQQETRSLHNKLKGAYT